jgi:DNA polymerase-1
MGIGKGHHLYLIDGSAYIFRAYHALPPLTRASDGLPVGAVAGFCGMLHKMVAGFGTKGPTHLAVIFDASAHSFRNAMFDGYKANRSEPPDDLRPQFALVRDAVRAWNLPCIEMEGFEADDLIATYAAQARDTGAQVTIVSSDKDLMQLIGPGIEMLDPMKSATIGPDEVFAKFGVQPARMIDVQALAGDSVDNIPGAPGIGVKTAAQLLAEYGDLDTLLARAGEIRQPKRRQTLIEHADQIRLSRELVTLRTDVPVETPLDAFELHPPDKDTLLAFLVAMEFRTLTDRIASALGAAPPVRAARAAPPAHADRPEGWRPGAVRAMPPMHAAPYGLVCDADALGALIAAAYETGTLALQVAADGPDPMQAGICGIALAPAPGQAAYVPVAHRSGETDLLGSGPVPGQLALDAVLAALGPVLADPSILKIGHDVKHAAKLLACRAIALAPADDAMLLSYAIESGLGGHSLTELAERHLGHRPPGLEELTGTGKAAIPFDRVALDRAAPFAAERADLAHRLWTTLRPRLAADRLSAVYHMLERPLVPVLAAMERTGIRIDADILRRFSARFEQKMAELEDDIFRLANRRFHIGSPKQLGEVLFDEMGFAGGKKTKTGAWATPADLLEQLAAEGHDLPARVLDWRQLSKLKSTYTDALPTYIHPETGRVHTTFALAATSTGRLSSNDPNLQNIPIRTEEGRAIRTAFVAAPGNTLVSLDYSQIELRILAHIADIPQLKQAFREGLDIHAMTASQVFGVPLDSMTPEIRRRAKAINFGVIYGISAFGLSNALRIPRADAQAFIDAYFDRFPGIRDYMEATKEGARSRGYVETLFGRRIHTPGIANRGPHRGFAERAAINAPIQGSAADIIRRAMTRIPAAMASAKLSGQMLLQVHDELLFEVPETQAQATVETARRTMQHAAHPAIHLSVPLVVEAGQGASWAEAH